MNQLFLQNLVFVLFLKIKYNMTGVLNDNFILIHDAFCLNKSFLGTALPILDFYLDSCFKDTSKPELNTKRKWFYLFKSEKKLSGF